LEQNEYNDQNKKGGGDLKQDATVRPSACKDANKCKTSRMGQVNYVHTVKRTRTYLHVDDGTDNLGHDTGGDELGGRVGLHCNN